VSRASAPRSAVAGAVAAGAALAAGQVATAVAGEQTDPVTAVGDQFVDRYAASLKDLAVELFGQNDKVALVVGIVVVSLLLGAALGVVARRSLRIAAGGLVAFAVLGLAAQLADPNLPATVAVAAAAAGAVAGVGALVVVFAVAGRDSVGDAPVRSSADDPARRPTDRRSFLVATGAVGLGAAFATWGASALRDRSRIADQRAAIDLPRPVHTTPVTARTFDEVNGLTPYVVPNDDFYRIDTALLTPQVDADSWRLRVTGMVDEAFELTFDELLALDAVEEPVTLACVSNEVGDDLVGNAVWQGVPLATLLERAGVQDGATQIVGRSTDGFTAGFPTPLATDGRVALVAYGMNGEPLPAAHGYPARLVVAGLYGYVSATKWLTEIELNAFDAFDAYWIPRGWSKLGPVKTQSRIDVPRHSATLAAGPVVVGGVAWAPSRGIRRVEVRVDDGPWQEAELAGAGNDNTWVQWRLRWDASPGEHLVRCRATDDTGEVQTAERAGPGPDGATGHHTVRITVRPGA
jgi:DMSO/TMAO reductase YedYZ molybdopterin-dependent catalytic subunit